VTRTIPTEDAASHPPTHPYHHGDLRNALVQAAVDLAREGGPAAIVLREAARRVGVSPTAAYRYFDSLPDLADAVAQAAMASMARTMEAELARCTPTGDPAQEALNNLRAVGRGYVRFALEEPGLFSTANTCPEGLESTASGVGDAGLSPAELLQQALAGLLAVGLLEPAGVEAAATAGWAVVHGLSTLLLGPMSGVPADDRQDLIDACLNIVGRGMTTQG
jgi:AcrR family transcriptional regulator